MDEANQASIRYDAFMIPIALSGGGDWRQKNVTMGRLLAKVMGHPTGTPFTISPSPMMGHYFGYAGAADHSHTYLFHTTHSRAGEERHEWTTLDSGVKVGRLKPDDSGPE